MKYSIEKLAKLSMLKVSKEEEKLVKKKLDALIQLLNKLDEVEVPKEAFVLAPEGVHEREDVPEKFESDEILKIFNETKDRYLKGPKTL